MRLPETPSGRLATVRRREPPGVLPVTKGDQRIIDEFVGHQTDEQRRRYRHLIPDIKQKAITGVFGG